MQCLIVAAGLGTRVRSLGDSKPLIPVAGQPLLSRVMSNAVAGGVSAFVIVVGHRAAEVEALAGKTAGAFGCPIVFVRNDAFEKPNGLSVVAAREQLADRFVLTMCDHLMTPECYVRMAAPVDAGTTVLGVDRALDNPLVDLDDVTRVATEAGRIMAIGKGLSDYDAFDTGLFNADHGLIEGISKSQRESGDASISGGMRWLGRQGRAKTRDLTGLDWLDVDDPAMVARAEQLIASGRLSA